MQTWSTDRARTALAWDKKKPSEHERGVRVKEPFTIVLTCLGSGTPHLFSLAQHALPPPSHTRSLSHSLSLFRAALSLLPSTRYIPNFTVDKLCVLNSPLRHRAPPLFVLSLHSTNQPPTCQQTSLLPVNSRHQYDYILCKYSGYFTVCHRAPVSSLHQRILKL